VPCSRRAIPNTVLIMVVAMTMMMMVMMAVPVIMRMMLVVMNALGRAAAARILAEQ
jgi:hypothetical protein